jgi:hypothetical protein
MADPAPNLDRLTVEGFGREWATFTQADGVIPDAERLAMFECYFALFPWQRSRREA